MTYEFLHSVFPNYTKEMYIGNEPKCFHLQINGDSIEEYEWQKCLSRNKIEKFVNLLKEILQENT